MRPGPPTLLDTSTELKRGPTPSLAFSNPRFPPLTSPKLPVLLLAWISVLAQTRFRRAHSSRKPTPFWEKITLPLPFRP